MSKTEMFSTAMLFEAIKFAESKKAFGVPNVKRTEIYTVLEHVFGPEVIVKKVTVEFMNEVAKAVKGTYENAGARAKIVF
jgi:hypothetical protein